MRWSLLTWCSRLRFRTHIPCPKLSTFLQPGLHMKTVIWPSVRGGGVCELKCVPRRSQTLPEALVGCVGKLRGSSWCFKKNGWKIFFHHGEKWFWKKKHDFFPKFPKIPCLALTKRSRTPFGRAKQGIFENFRKKVMDFFSTSLFSMMKKYFSSIFF